MAGHADVRLVFGMKMFPSPVRVVVYVVRVFVVKSGLKCWEVW